MQSKESSQKSNSAENHLPEKGSLSFQPKLTINQANDIYEQEADAMADKVMRMSNPSINNNLFFKPAIPSFQRKCAHCEEEERQMHRKEINSDGVTADTSTENYINSLSGKGRSLTSGERSFFEPRFGYDFSNVQLHTNSDANQSAQSIHALAYTHDNNIVFGANQYQPNSESGKRLMAHELTHVVQQGSLVSRSILQRDVGWARRGTPYGPPLTSEQSSSVTETISNASAGNEKWNGTFTITSKFTLSFDLNTEQVTVIMRLYSTALPAVKSGWKSAIESKWSNKFKLDTLNADNSVFKSSPILVNIQWVDDAATAHFAITPHTAGETVGGRAGLGGTSSEQDWGTADTVDITHEFGHMLGNAEEYFTTNGIDYTAGGTKSGFRDPGGDVMNNPSGDPLPSHYNSVRVEFAKLIGKDSKFVRVSAI